MELWGTPALTQYSCKNFPSKTIPSCLLGKGIPKSSRLELLEKCLGYSFALSDAEDTTSGALNRGVVADLLLLKKLQAIHQKLQEPRFWEVISSFILLKWARLTASSTLLQQLLAYLNFT